MGVRCQVWHFWWTEWADWWFCTYTYLYYLIFMLFAIMSDLEQSQPGHNPIYLRWNDIHQAAQYTELVVSNPNCHPSIGHSGKVRVVCCKMKKSSSNKKLTNISGVWNEICQFSSRMHGSWHIHFPFRTSGLHIPSAFEGVFFFFQ